MSKRSIIFSFILFTTFAGAGDPMPKPRLMPTDLERDLALSALPTHLREGAGYFLLKEDGFKEAKTPDNGFSCLVRRSVSGQNRSDLIIPVCYDTEGTEAVIPVILKEAQLVAEGKSGESIQAEIAMGFRRGMFRPFQKSGISYMLSSVLELPGPKGTILKYLPHYMFYHPFSDNQAVGGTNDRFSGLPFIIDGGPHGMIILPAGKLEIDAIREEQTDLMQRVESFKKAGT